LVVTISSAASAAPCGRLADDGRFIITVPNPIHQLWIESNHTAAVADAVAEVTGVPAVIEFHVATEPVPASAAFVPMPEIKAARVTASDQAAHSLFQ
jgi:chromosomal replication initiator protein